jgi:hypothetical protein
MGIFRMEPMLRVMRHWGYDNKLVFLYKF